MQSQTLDQPLATPDSSSRTTPPGPKGLSFDEQFGSLREVPFDCPVHGPVTARQVCLSSGWTDARCPDCDREREAKAEAAEVERQQAVAAERRRSAVQANLARSGIPARFELCDFAGYVTTDPGQRKALTRCREYAGGLATHLRTGASLILCGTAGTGKTHLACAIAREAILTHVQAVRFTTVGKAMRAVKSTYRRQSEDTEDDALREFTRPGLLILDEVGVQFGSDAERNILFEIVNERYGAMLPTILISNLALDGLREFVGDRVLDRLKENGGQLVVFDWVSHRGKQQAEPTVRTEGFDRTLMPRYTKAELGL